VNCNPDCKLPINIFFTRLVLSTRTVCIPPCMKNKESAEKAIRDIRRATRPRSSALAMMQEIEDDMSAQLLRVNEMDAAGELAPMAR